MAMKRHGGRRALWLRVLFLLLSRTFHTGFDIRVYPRPSLFPQLYGLPRCRRVSLKPCPLLLQQSTDGRFTATWVFVRGQGYFLLGGPRV